jgi:hypothetical protein
VLIFHCFIALSVLRKKGKKHEVETG